MKEAALKSSSRTARMSTNYLLMNEHLENRILIIPDHSLIEIDYLFLAFTTPKKIIERNYDYLLSEKQFRKIRRRVGLKAYPASWKIQDVNKYYVLEDISKGKDLFLFVHEGNYVFMTRGFMDEALGR
jgi:hypothetical protein